MNHLMLFEVFFLRVKKNDTICTPHLWWYETHNVLHISLKRKRLHQSDIYTILQLLDKLHLDIDYSIGYDVSNEILNIAQQYNLSAYDSSYMELAKRKKAHLMSFDKKMISAAKSIGLRINQQ